MRCDTEVIKRLMTGVVTLEDAVAIITADLPRLTDADLASLLLEIRNLGPHPLGQVVEPIVRAELAKRHMAALAECYSGDR